MEAPAQLEYNRRQPAFSQQHRGLRQEQFACLYTKHKTQKRKVWNDGRLVLRCGIAALYDANPALGSSNPSLDQCELSNAHREALLQGKETRLEFENFLIEVDGIWRNPPETSLSHTPVPLVSSSMQKLFGRKFQKPQSYIPPPPTLHKANNLRAILGKRKRPLQPGELIRLHHGRDATSGYPEVSEDRRPEHSSQLREESMILNVDTLHSQDNSCTFSTANRATSPFPPIVRPTPNSMAQSRIQGHYRPHSPSMQNPSTSNGSAIRLASCSGDVRDHDTGDGPHLVASPRQNFSTPNPNSAIQQEEGKQQESDSKQASAVFVSNEFNASSFYGLDDEEDEASFCPGESRAAQQSQPAAFSIPFTNSLNLPVESTPNALANDPILGRIEGKSRRSQAVSDSALLKLFGATDPTDSGNMEKSAQAAAKIPIRATDDLSASKFLAESQMDQVNELQAELFDTKQVFVLQSPSSSENSFDEKW
eukprot:scaffold6433_cov125-Cylindrotheca_fusiformis.AAC.10